MTVLEAIHAVLLQAHRSRVSTHPLESHRVVVKESPRAGKHHEHQLEDPFFPLTKQASIMSISWTAKLNAPGGVGQRAMQLMLMMLACLGGGIGQRTIQLMLMMLVCLGGIGQRAI